MDPRLRGDDERPMELILFFTKFIEYTVVAPLWWAATWLAALFFPLEGDRRQDLLGVVFSLLILAGLYVGYAALSGRPTPPATDTSAAQTALPQPDMDELKAQMETLKAIKSMNAGLPAEAGR
jgi:hypothetical protein